ncbi:MAG: hypothetical protein WAM30_20245 [Candidatus Dormiibacterota bacterium]
MRQPILYAEQTWRQQRLWVIILFVLGVGFTIYSYFFQHPSKAQASQGLLGYSNYIFIAYIPAAVLLLLALMYYRRRHVLIAGDEGITVQTMFKQVAIPWDDLRSVRVRPLLEHFEAKERKRLVRTTDRPLLQRGALYLKLKADDTLLQNVRRQLGPRIVADDTLAIPIPDPDAFSWEVSSHLPMAVGQNLGGAKRRRGKRRR